MAVQPIIERELRLGSRKPRTYLTRCAFALLACFIRQPAAVPKTVGDNPIMWWENRQLYRWISVLGFLLLAGATWAFCYVRFRRAWLNAEMMFLATSILRITLKGWMAIEAMRSSMHGFLRTLVLVVARPWVVYMVSVFLAGMAFGAAGWTIAWWFVICIVNCFWLCHTSSRNLETRFRIAASTA